MQRPTLFNATSISFDTREQRYRLEVQDMGWYNGILERYLDAGYAPRPESLGSVASIIVLLQSLPSELADVIKAGLHALQILRAEQTALRQPLVPTFSTSERMGQFAAMEDDMWERDEQCGYLRFEWDPVTERRRCASSPAKPLRAFLHRTPSTT